MHLFNRLLNYPRAKSIVSELTHNNEEEKRRFRITKRELIPSHRAQPFLVQSLLLADEVGARTNSTSGPSMESILQILQFSKRMKWLCEWGPEIVDESLRPPSAALPLCIERKMADSDSDNAVVQSREELLALLGDATQHWDRIILPMYDPEFLKLLHLHPCQELWIEFYDEDLSLNDMCNIAKCTDLRILSLGHNRTSAEGMQALQKLPYLKQIVFHESVDAFPCVEAQIQLPQLTMIQINPPNMEDHYHPAFYPFTNAHMDVVLEYIRKRRECTRQIHIVGSVGVFLFACLRQFTQVQSISIVDNVYASEDNDVDYLLKWENLQKTVRHIFFGWAGINADAASNLAMFKNILWLEFESLSASSDKLVPAIIANANNLVSLSIHRCENVGDDILGEIAKCKRLQMVDLQETGVSVEAIKKYRSEKRPNWDKIMYEKTDFTTGIIHAIKSQGGEMEAYQDPHVLARIDAE